MILKERSSMSQPTYQRAVDLLEAELGEEMVALDAEAGTCFGFNEVAATVWRELESPKTAADLRTALLAEYEVDPEQCDRELADLLQDLSARGLITRILN
jgi:hypothetical protein